MAKISHMVLPVSDLPRSRDWYVDKLGFKVE
jgi:catechol 2,3-dioxygenase-like lactoylglutathione lyase family enzyme